MSLKSPHRILNAITVDVEDYFHVSGFANVVRPGDWSGLEGRVEANTFKLLEIFADYNVSATFFVLGWVADRYPSLVQAIQGAGHEVGSHGYGHKLVYRCSREEFCEDLRRSKRSLEDLTGERVAGYRAPSFSIDRKSLWAFEILAEEGISYDSSIFPIYRDRYGFPTANRFPHWMSLNSGLRLFEFPLATWRFLGVNFPIAGGGYLRLFPYPWIRYGLCSLNFGDDTAAVLYLHPWELDANQPRLNGSWISRTRHYVNLHTTERKVRGLLADFSFTSLRSLYAELATRRRSV